MHSFVLASIAVTATTVLLVSANGDPADRSTQTPTPAALESEHRAHVLIPEVELGVYAGVASGLVLADVVEVRTIDEPGLLLRTEYVLEILESYFGEAIGHVTVQVAGGATATRSFVVDGAPHLVIGQRGLFFLGDAVSEDARGILGLARGCYDVHSEGRELVVRGHLAPEPISLDRFVTDVIDARETFFVQEAR